MATIASIPDCSVKINGSEISTKNYDRLSEVTVEQSLHLPAMFVMRLYDIVSVGEEEPAAPYGIFDQSTFAIGAEVEIQLGYVGALAGVIKGEITGLELEASPDSPPAIVVRGYDRGHRLHRGRQIKSYLNQKDSDIVSTIAGAAGLSASVEATTVQHPYLLQNNLTNWEFLRELAAKDGYELFVDDRSLKFRKPKKGTVMGPVQEFGDNLISFRVKVSTAHQASEVTVRSWDMQTKAAIVGTATTGAMEPETAFGKTATQASSGFGPAKVAIVNRPMTDVSAANTMAQAVLDALDGAFIQAEGVAGGDTGIKPGVTLELKELGAKLSGKYYVTSATHRYSLEGYVTTFTVSGRQSDSLLELMGGPPHEGTFFGVVTGLVTDNTDPEGNLGRVKVKFPWLADNEQSWWARVASPMAGPERGIYFIPEVNDEVLVAFEHGDITRPFVVGSLWNGQDKPPKANSAVVANSKVNERIIKTRAGHTISLDDTDGSEKISITDKTGKNMIMIESSSNKITIQSEADVAITAKAGVTVNAEKDVLVEAKGNATVKAGGNIEATAQGNATLKATGTTEVSSSATLNLKGASVNIESQGLMNIKASGPLAVKGAVINLN